MTVLTVPVFMTREQLEAVQRAVHDARTLAIQQPGLYPDGEPLALISADTVLWAAEQALQHKEALARPWRDRLAAHLATPGQ